MVEIEEMDDEVKQALQKEATMQKWLSKTDFLEDEG